MIIVNQWKNELVNFDRIDSIWIYVQGEGRVIIEAATENDKNIALGEYQTEERAREVLQEIGIFYEKSKRNECSSNNGVAIFLEITFMYNMPEE